MDNQIVIRPAGFEDAEAIAQIHVKAWQESYKDIISSTYLNALSYRKRLNLRRKILAHHKTESLHLVALVDGEVAGFCDAGPSFGESTETPGELYAIYVLDKYKGKGVGTELMKEVEKFFIERVYSSYFVWILEDNKPACNFYEKRGGTVTATKTENIGDQQLKALGYVFAELKA
jgi:ribosomal protein S18 acetylase RimI-like enzyme